MVMVNNLSAFKQKTDPKWAQILRIISPSLSFMGLRERRHIWCQNIKKGIHPHYLSQHSRIEIYPRIINLIRLLPSLQEACSLLLHLLPSRGWSRSLGVAPWIPSCPSTWPAAPKPPSPCQPWQEPCSCNHLPSGALPNLWCPALSSRPRLVLSSTVLPQQPEMVECWQFV